MKRETEQHADGCTAAAHNSLGNCGQADADEKQAKKLADLAKLITNLRAEQEQITAQMDSFRQEGKTKSVRFRELMGQKLFNSNVLNLLERYSLL